MLRQLASKVNLGSYFVDAAHGDAHDVGWTSTPTFEPDFVPELSILVAMCSP